MKIKFTESKRVCVISGVNFHSVVAEEFTVKKLHFSANGVPVKAGVEVYSPKGVPVIRDIDLIGQSFTLDFL